MHTLFFLPSDARESMALVIAMSICRSAHQFCPDWIVSTSIECTAIRFSQRTNRQAYPPWGWGYLFWGQTQQIMNDLLQNFVQPLFPHDDFVMTLCRPWVSSSICLIPWLWTNQIENKCLHCTSLQTTDMLNHVVFLALVRFGRQNHHALVTTNSTNISFLSPQSELEIVQRSP